MVHTGLGIAIIADNRASAVLILVGLDRMTKSLNLTEMGILLISFSMLACLGLTSEERLSRKFVIALLFPQYVLLIASFMSNVWLIAGGYENAAGQHVPTSVVFSALWTAMVGAILHTLGIVERYFWKWNIPTRS